MFFESYHLAIKGRTRLLFYADFINKSAGFFSFATGSTISIYGVGVNARLLNLGFCINFRGVALAFDAQRIDGHQAASQSEVTHGERPQG